MGANDDNDADAEIGLPGLPPSIARVEVEAGFGADEGPTGDMAHTAPVKPRRGRRPKQPEAAE